MNQPLVDASASQLFSRFLVHKDSGRTLAEVIEGADVFRGAIGRRGAQAGNGSGDGCAAGAHPDVHRYALAGFY